MADRGWQSRRMAERVYWLDALSRYELINSLSCLKMCSSESETKLSTQRQITGNSKLRILSFEVDSTAAPPT